MASGGQPAFSGRGGGGQRTSLGPRDGAARGGRGGRGGGRGRSRKPLNGGNFIGPLAGGISSAAARAEELAKEDDHALEGALGFPLFTEGEDRLGWLMNLNSTIMENKDSGQMVSAVNCYFMCQDGSMFKAQVEFAPYFYVQLKDGAEREVDAYLRRKYEGNIKEIEVVEREDLDLKNHLSGLKRRLLKVSFSTVQQLMDVRRDLAAHVRRNAGKSRAAEAYNVFAPAPVQSGAASIRDALDSVVDLREHDVPYHVRFLIDADVRCGHWYTVSAKEGRVSLRHEAELVRRAEPRICAFDIETTKLPLQFPNSEYDQVFMISYMVNGEGFLIVNREVVAEDIQGFEYSPKPEYKGPFTVWNEPDEAATLRRWFEHMREVQPGIYVTYNGDFFDWPFLEDRAAKHGLDMHERIGFRMDKKSNQCLSRFAVHMDCLAWVNRDSYLPQGSRGLKAVTRAKLGYEPVEVDAEDMVRFAAEQPQLMASYSVSDAVATYYLYMSYIHPFIFSLSTVIPMSPDEVLRKGSGTLCEMLLMVQAYQANVVAPNKHVSATEATFRGHLLENETYIGGKVEALQSGVFRSDLPTRFRCKPAAYQALIDSLDDDLRFAIEVEGGRALADVANYGEVRDAIRAKLEALRDRPNADECPLIYHLDVAAMYPNIILTNRLQPSAIVSDEDCAACLFNRPGKDCLRRMEWVWRGETFAATTAEYFSIKNQLASEPLPPAPGSTAPRAFDSLPPEERARLLKDRLKKYCQKVYKRVLDKPVLETRTAGVCMRENDFYVGTVRAFRDRRYEYKGLTKQWKGKLDAAKAGGSEEARREAGDMVVLYDSLQLAHKCILNSFYGYVMRRGARWYSMEMAGVVTNTGAQIIQRANELVGGLGVPLELDTDGIWCALPGSFPENYKFTSVSGQKALPLSYPCVMLNVMVAKHNTNDQYQDLVDVETKTYKRSSQMSIEFEVDGPYKAMILPASKEEGKLIKKRYAVFNEDGSLAELKGFEIKRRGELKLIKLFQGEVFERFLAGDSLEACYAAVAAVANKWLDLIDYQGDNIEDDEELTAFISESSTMSKSLDEYDGRKSCAITCAKRLAEFLGDARIRDRGLNCTYVVAKRPESQPTSERAIPVAIFQTSAAVARAHLRKWCGDVGTSRGPDQVPDIRDIVDWDYYRERLGSAIQKIITIPAAMQRVPNPVPRVPHPDWLQKQVREKENPFQQRTLDAFLAAAPAGDSGKRAAAEMEDFGGDGGGNAKRGGVRAAATSRAAQADKENAGEQAAAEAEAEERPCPARQEDPAGWLRFRKRKWRAAAEARRQRRKAAEVSRKRARFADQAAAEAEPRGAGVGGYLRQQNAEATASHWQLVHLTPTGQPGQFRAWALVGSALYAVPLTVPRVFYVNSTLPAGDAATACWGAPVRRTLPFGEQPHHIYQIEMEEGSYLESSSDVALRLAASDVRGVWEERLPLALHAALSAGCVAALRPGAGGGVLREGCALSDLQRRSTADCPYLEGDGPEGLGPLRQLLLYHSADAAAGRGVWALHVPMHKRLLLVVVSPATGRDARAVTATALEQFWAEGQARVGGDASGTAAEVTFVTSQADALRALGRAVSEFRQRHRGPALIVLEAPGGAARLAPRLPLLAEFPVVQVTAHSADCAYPALQWQPRAAKVAALRLCAAAVWVKEQVGLARYSHVPLGNVGGDWVLDTADVLFARALRDANHLLWAEDATLPDVAAKGDPAARAEEPFESGQLGMEVVYPGAYRSVCVRLEVQHLAVAAVANSALLGELEGAAGAESAAGVGPAFRVLRGLVQAWLLDARDRGNRFADELLKSLWRWLCSPAAALGCPGLRQAVAGLMRKCLAQLVDSMRRLGATVVAADAASIVLATGKHTLAAAVGYVDYLLEALLRQELFGLLDLSPRAFWHTLLFRDRHNFFGIRARVPEPLQQQLGSQPGALSQAGRAALPEDLDADADREPEYDAVWNIKEFLPPAVQDAFLFVTMEFVLLPWKAARAAAAAEAESSQAPVDERAVEAAQAAWLREHMRPHFGRKLLQLVAKVRKQVLPGAGRPEHEFPQLPGSHLSPAELGTPALAYTKAVLEVLGLDHTVAEETALLRRNLLRLLQTREFAPEAAFQDPCRTYVLRDVICSYCSACCDLDLCRDPQLQAGKAWACAECGHARDMGAIETRLLDVVRRRTRAFQLQDLKCVRCRQVSSGHLSRQCRMCGGGLACTETREQLAGGLAVFRSVARAHGFALLAETTHWLLQ